jgi:hypothetical protein
VHVKLVDVVLFMHIFIAIATFGVAIVLLLSLHQMKRAATVEVLHSWERVAARCGPLFPVLVLVLIGLGAWLIHLSGGEFRWSDGWVDTAVVGLVLMEAYGGAVLAPADKKLGELVAAAAPGPVPENVRAAVRSPKVWAGSYGNTGTALGILFTMPTKPEAPWPIVIVAGMGILGILLGLRLSEAFETAPATPAHAAAPVDGASEATA